jgi:amidase
MALAWVYEHSFLISVSGSPRQNIVPSTAGPMATSLSSIEAYMEALAHIEPWTLDPGMSPIPWRLPLCTTAKRLKIGYVIDDGVVKVQPPVARAVKIVITALQNAGHEG